MKSQYGWWVLARAGGAHAWARQMASLLEQQMTARSLEASHRQPPAISCHEPLSIHHHGMVRQGLIFATVCLYEFANIFIMISLHVGSEGPFAG